MPITILEIAFGDLKDVNNTLRAATLFLAPVLLVTAAQLAMPLLQALPPELAGLRSLGPWTVMAFAAAIAMAFNRSRAMLVVLWLVIAYSATFRWRGDGGDTASAALVAMVAMLLPVNFAVLALLRERGFLSPYGLRRLGAIFAQCLVAAWMLDTRPAAVLAFARHAPPLLDPAWLHPLPPVGLGAALAGVAVAGVVAVLRRSAIEAGIAGALVAVAAGGLQAGTWLALPVFLTFAAAIVAVGVLQDAFRLAFRDELTGLPSRRALNERLLSLGEHYTLAMADVDHFKKFNDTHGHDVGDQVLRMVASRLERVGGGGRVYRYGGEEFTVVFEGLRAREAIPHLEAVRADIEGYTLAIRAADREPEQGRGRRGRGARARGSVSVTASFGVAERDDRHRSPEAVLKAADGALYRAKEKGRNRVSR